MNEYTLYLDESEIPIKDDNDNIINVFFAIGGIVVRNDYHDGKFTEEVINIKKTVWHEEKYSSICDNFILHELEVTHAHYKHFKKLKCKYNKVFAQYSRYNLLYEEISKLMSNKEITTLCSYINENELKRIYPYEVLNDRLSILMQILIENYYHFLIKNNSIGNICYEYIDEGQNKIVKRRYDNIRQTGTMFYPAKEINRVVKSLYFRKKSENIAGLQLADFIPNTLGRYKCEKENNSNKNFNSIYSNLYDGYIGMQNKFGLKEIP